MAKEKTTVTLDRATVDEVVRLTGARSTSEAIAIALQRLVRAERLRRDVEAYTKVPPTGDAAALAGVPPDWSDLADDTDWVALHP
jgi:Arc/MetJ family transcription regulator